MSSTRARVMAASAAMALALLGPIATQAQSTKPDAHSGHHPPGAAPTPQTPAPKMGGMKGGMKGGHSGMMADMMMRPGSAAGLPHMILHHTEGYLAFLKAELQITTEQAPLWTAFADVTRQSVKQLRGQTTAHERSGAAQSWPELLAESEKALTAQLDALKAIRPAAVALYAGLTPEQKKKADQLTAGGMGMQM
jgi:hypothetical protein